MLAENNAIMGKAISGVWQLTEDERIREQCRAREEWIINDKWKRDKIAEQEAELKKKDSMLEKKDSEIKKKDSMLEKKDSMLEKKDSEIEELKSRDKENIRTIEKLMREIKEMKSQSE